MYDMCNVMSYAFGTGQLGISPELFFLTHRDGGHTRRNGETVSILCSADMGSRFSREIGAWGRTDVSHLRVFSATCGC